MAKRKPSNEKAAVGPSLRLAGLRQPGRLPRAQEQAQPARVPVVLRGAYPRVQQAVELFRRHDRGRDLRFSQRDATTGHRPTWRTDQQRAHQLNRKVEEAFYRMFGESGATVRHNARLISARDKDALAQLDLEHPVDRKMIKAQYRTLVKKYHPDVNRGNARAEETFKKITRAYHHLIEHYVES